MSNSGASERAAAARVVAAVLYEGRSLDQALADLDGGDDPFVRMLSYGTLRFHFRLQAGLQAFIDKPLRKRDRIIMALLEVGLFQLRDTRVPDHAAVSATVEAARLLDRPRLSGLVNAVLRRSRREAPPVSGAEAEFNHPAWIIERLKADWPEDWQQILEANDARAPMWLRVNIKRTSVADAREMLDAAGIGSEPHAALPQGLRLNEALPVSSLPGFAEGLLSVQDGGAQLAAPWCLGPPESQSAPRRILDACAAPGGKSAHLLELGGADDVLTCIDIDADRAATIGQNLERLGLEGRVVAADASKPGSWWDGELFDAVLLDAPCSASGVIRRHPDIKLLRRNSDIDALSTLQAELLSTAWTLVKPGGRLLYVTCSVFSQENDGVIEPFLDTQRDAREQNVLHNNNIRDVMRLKARGFQLLPGQGGMDGFYFACLEKAT